MSTSRSVSPGEHETVFKYPKEAEWIATVHEEELFVTGRVVRVISVAVLSREQMVSNFESMTGWPSISVRVWPGAVDFLRGEVGEMEET